MKKQINFYVIVIPLVISVLARGLFLYHWAKSPFPYYSYIPTLDMNQLLKWGIAAADHGSFNSLYILFLSLIYKVAGSIYFIPAIVCAQLLLGVLITVLVVYIAWYLTSCRYTSLLSGCIVAVYAPLLMYEGFILKTTLFTLLSVLLLFYILHTQSKNFRKYDLIVIGLIAGMLILVRFSGVLWSVLAVLWCIFNISSADRGNSIGKSFRIHFLKKISGLFCIVIGISVISAAVGFYNGSINVGAFSSLLNKKWFNYVQTVGNQPEIKTVNIQKADPYAVDLQTEDGNLFNYFPGLKKLLMMFSAEEIPNNLNYYFIEKGLFPLNYLINPLVLFIVGLSGLLIFVIFTGNYSFVSLIILFIFSSVLPASYFVPLARYKVVMAPLLCILGAFFIIQLMTSLRQKNGVKLFIFLVILFLFTALQLNYSSGNRLRSSDFIAYAKALEFQKAAKMRIIEAYRLAYFLDKKDLPSVLNYSDILMKNGRYAEAADVLFMARQSYPEKIEISLLYASALLGKGDIVKAGEILKSIDIKNKNSIQYINYIYNMAEYNFLIRDYKSALKYYKILLNSNQKIINKKFIHCRIKLIDSKSNVLNQS